jgi:hypothetical protein
MIPGIAGATNGLVVAAVAKMYASTSLVAHISSK